VPTRHDITRRGPRVLRVLVCALTVLLGASCRESSAPSAAVPAADAERLVVLSPALAVMLTDLGHAGKVVGKHAYDMLLPASVPVVGDNFDIDYELLLRLQPTRVYTQAEAAGVPARLNSLARERGFRVRDFRLLSLDQLASAMDALADELGDESASAGDGLLPSQRLAADWADRGPQARAAGRVLLLGSADPPAALGPGSFHHDLLLRLGGVSALDAGSPWMELDAEDILRLAPDAIVLFAPRAPDARDDEPEPWDRTAARLGALARLPIPAVESRRVAVIDHPLGLLPSSALGPVGRELGDLLVGWGDQTVGP
jgi:ABC-type Fe3+-hydroxamate transport system substrate-binding protein